MTPATKVVTVCQGIGIIVAADGGRWILALGLLCLLAALVALADGKEEQ